MHILDILSGPDPKISFEFFPPRSADATAQLFHHIDQLQAFSPAFVSVTYGAGGTTRSATRELSERILRETSLQPIPHLTCVGHTKGEISKNLESYVEVGIFNLLALRGDPPKSGSISEGDFRTAADLVAFIQRFSETHGYRFGIGVAGFPEGHPATPNRMLEMDYLKAKVDAGADYLCTQLFFDNHDFHDFRSRCELAGIRVPILAGIMPATSLQGLRRMSELAGGARVPANLDRALARAMGDPIAVEKIGIHHATVQCADLLDHQVDGIHLYTLNQSAPSIEILQNLGLQCATAPL